MSPNSPVDGYAELNLDGWYANLAIESQLIRPDGTRADYYYTNHYAPSAWAEVHDDHAFGDERGDYQHIVQMWINGTLVENKTAIVTIKNYEARYKYDPVSSFHNPDGSGTDYYNRWECTHICQQAGIGEPHGRYGHNYVSEDGLRIESRLFSTCLGLMSASVGPPGCYAPR